MLPYNEYEQKLLDLMRRQAITVTMGALQNQRLVLGGVRSSGGGGGGPIQPFIGKLTQSRVTFDEDEYATITIPSGELASLLHNLNRIRHGTTIVPSGGLMAVNYTVPSGANLIQHLVGIDSALTGIAASGGHVIQDEGTPLPSRPNLNFVGAAVTAADDAGNNATKVTITASGGGSGAWPGANKFMIDTTEYSAFATACAAASSGDLIKAGEGTFTCDDVNLPSGVHLWGSGKGITILQTTTNTQCLVPQGHNIISDLIARNEYDSASDAYGIRIEGPLVTLRNVKGAVDNPSGGGYGINLRSDGIILENTDGESTGTGTNIGLYNFGGTNHEIIGGKYSGDDADIDSGGGYGVFTLRDPQFVNNKIATVLSGGTYTGRYFDDAHNLVSIGSWQAAETNAFVVKNTSGGSVVTGDVGYIDEAGEYKETTTAYNVVAWCVVMVGGDNNDDIYVSRVGRVIATLNGNCSVGDYLYTSTTAGQAQPLSYMRPEVLGVARTANTGGAGGTCEALLLTGRTYVPLVSSSETIQYTTVSRSQWSTTINGAPSGTTVTYAVGGTWQGEDAIEPAAAGYLSKCLLHNSTRSNFAKIDSVNTTAHTITVTSSADISTWQNGDTITAHSTTNTSSPIGNVYFFDYHVESTEIPALTTVVWLYLQNWRDNGATGTQLWMHPYETNDSPKRSQWQNNLTSGTGGCGNTFPQQLINRRWCMAWDSSAASQVVLTWRVRGVTLAAP